MSKRQKPVSWCQSFEYTYPPELHAELVQRNLKAGLCAHGFAHEDDCPTCKRTPNVAQEFADADEARDLALNKMGDTASYVRTSVGTKGL